MMTAISLLNSNNSDRIVITNKSNPKRESEILCREMSDATIFFGPGDERNGRFLSFMPMKFAEMGEKAWFIHIRRNANGSGNVKKRILAIVAPFWHDGKMVLEIV